VTYRVVYRRDFGEVMNKSVKFIRMCQWLNFLLLAFNCFCLLLLMLFEDTYKTIEVSAEGIFRDRASKFIAWAIPVDNELDVKLKLAELKKQYWDAAHQPYAYVLGFDKTAFRFNDDGEPSGTAGRPIYGQIQSKDLTNVLIVVIRYFGGTKLGVSGLITAFKTAARLALENAVIVERVVREVFEISFPYDRMNDIMKLLKDEHLEQGAHQFELECKLEFKVRKNDSMRIIDKFTLMENVHTTYLRTE